MSFMDMDMVLEAGLGVDSTQPYTSIGDPDFSILVPLHARRGSPIPIATKTHSLGFNGNSRTRVRLGSTVTKAPVSKSGAA